MGVERIGWKRMKTVRAAVWLVVTATFLTAVPAGGATAGPARRLRAGTSTNWSGYAVSGARYSQVSASWVQPTVNCSPGETSTAGFWVGLDGRNSPTVEQTGTIAGCRDGVAFYFGFWETYPQPVVRIPDPLAPGDSVTAEVRALGRGRFEMILTNVTAGWTFRITRRARRAQQASAEVIAEALQTGSGELLPLSNFGTVTFNGATVDGAPIGTLAPEALVMVTEDGTTVRGQPSPLTDPGSFSVSWLHS